MIKYDFKEKNVIVTGASMGLGREIAKQFAIAHANVVIVDINGEEAARTKQELEQYGTTVLAYKLDVSNFNQIQSMVNKVIEKLGRIDILVNNAGICECVSLIDMDQDKIDRMLKININGTIYGCKAVLPIMKEQKYGKIINMSSIAAKLGSANVSVYSATKAAVLELTACLAREYALDNININCVLPGIIRTPLWEKLLDELTNDDISKKDEVFSSFTSGIPMGRPQDPIDIANAVLFLADDDNKNITAQNLGVDGGQTY